MKLIQISLAASSHDRLDVVALFQPAYAFGLDEQGRVAKPQIYLPGGLMNLGARLLRAGIEASLTDLNLESLDDPAVQQRLSEAKVLGFTVLGPVYISVITQTIEAIRALGYHQPVLIGGQGVARMQAVDFKAWFGHLEAVYQVTGDQDLAERLGVIPGQIPSAFETSMAPMFSRITPSVLDQYLMSEFCLFLSQGCKYPCGFCAAAKSQREQYRTLEALEAELRAVCSELRRLGNPTLCVYLSNLDALQNPAQLEAAMQLVARVAAEFGITPDVRCLATSGSTFKANAKDPELLARLRSYGLTMIAFGADGSDVETWRREQKRHNVLHELEAVVIATREAGITVELLMVIGFPHDRWKQMWSNLRFSFRHARQGSIIRPYLAKFLTPGGGHWVGTDPEIREDNPQVAAFRSDAKLLRRIDYAMVGSPETHPIRWQRWASNAVYLLLIAVLAPFKRCPTSPLFPEPERGLGRRLVQWVNRQMPTDR